MKVLLSFILTILGGLLLVFGTGMIGLLVLAGLGSGLWGIAHGYPLLIVGVPSLILGYIILRVLHK